MTIAATDTALQRDLRTAGLRTTQPRLAVLRLLRQSSLPLSHLEVVDRLGDRGWNRATLYRNLMDLARTGLARRTELGDRVWRFVATGPATAHRHPHFVCGDCGRVACLQADAVKVAPGTGAPAAVRRDEFEIVLKGRCDRCRKVT